MGMHGWECMAILERYNGVGHFPLGESSSPEVDLPVVGSVMVAGSVVGSSTCGLAPRRWRENRGGGGGELMCHQRRAGNGTCGHKASRRPLPVPTLLPVRVASVREPSEHLPFAVQIRNAILPSHLFPLVHFLVICGNYLLRFPKCGNIYPVDAVFFPQAGQ